MPGPLTTLGQAGLTLFNSLIRAAVRGTGLTEAFEKWVLKQGEIDPLVSTPVIAAAQSATETATRYAQLGPHDPLSNTLQGLDPPDIRVDVHAIVNWDDASGRRHWFPLSVEAMWGESKADVDSMITIAALHKVQGSGGVTFDFDVVTPLWFPREPPI